MSATTLDKYKELYVTLFQGLDLEAETMKGLVRILKLCLSNIKTANKVLKASESPAAVEYWNTVKIYSIHMLNEANTRVKMLAALSAGEDQFGYAYISACEICAQIVQVLEQEDLNDNVLETLGLTKDQLNSITGVFETVL
jgi:hypothetical protein